MFRNTVGYLFNLQNRPPTQMRSACGSNKCNRPPPAGCGGPAVPKQPPPPSKRKCKVLELCQPKSNCSGNGFKSMWEPPPNLPEPYPFRLQVDQICCEKKAKLPRFDVLYYYPSCHKRELQRTWVECPEYLVRKRKICCYEKLYAIEPPRRGEKRPPGCVPATACSSKNRKCPLLAKLANCREGRRLAKCYSNRSPKCCSKLCAPMPSWSECKKRELKVPFLPPPECFCQVGANNCAVLEYRKWIMQFGSPKLCSQRKKCKSKD